MVDDPDIDVRKYRPLEVNLTIVLLNLQAELTMVCCTFYILSG